jgi:hypothetical protein
MSWSETLIFWRERFEREGWLAAFRDGVPTLLSQFRAGSWAALNQVASEAAQIFLGLGPDSVRAELAPIKHVVPQSVADYLSTCEGTGTMLFDVSDPINVFQIHGFDVPPTVLDSLRPYLLRVGTARNDVPARHWTKALTAIVVGEPFGWTPIAGAAKPEQLRFKANEEFGANVQAFIGHLGAAVGSKAQLDAVMPAWLDFLRTADPLMDANQIDMQVILWAGRIVYHHIGGEALGTVADQIYADIGRLAEDT